MTPGELLSSTPELRELLKNVEQGQESFERKVKETVPYCEQVGDLPFQAFAKMKLNLTLAEAMEMTPRELDAFLDLYLHENGRVRRAKTKSAPRRIEIRALNQTIIKRLKTRPEKFSDLAAALSTDQKILRKALNGGEVTIRKANEIESKARCLPTVPQNSFSGAEIKRVLATK